MPHDHGGCCGGHHHGNHGCGHHHSHKDCASGCCGHSHDHEVHLTEADVRFILLLAETPFLPVTRFLMRSSHSGHLSSIALAPVYLTSREDSMEVVKAAGQSIKRLAELALVSLDYDIPLEGCDYSDYEESQLYAYLRETIAEAQGRPGFLFDQPGQIGRAHV